MPVEKKPAEAATAVTTTAAEAEAYLAGIHHLSSPPLLAGSVRLVQPFIKGSVSSWHCVLEGDYGETEGETGEMVPAARGSQNDNSPTKAQPIPQYSSFFIFSHTNR